MNPKSRLSSWFPTLAEASIPMPEALMVYALGESLDNVSNEIVCYGEEFQFPCFIRNDFVAARLYWDDTCFFSGSGTDRKFDAIRRMSNLKRFCEAIDDDIPCDVFIVRPYVYPSASFLTKTGYPVSPERIYQVVNGQMVHHMSKWNQRDCIGSTDPNSVLLLEKWSVEGQGEVAYLTRLSEKAGRALGGSWAFQWFCTKRDGWILIDAKCTEAYETEGGLTRLYKRHVKPKQLPLPLSPKRRKKISNRDAKAVYDNRDKEWKP